MKIPMTPRGYRILRDELHKLKGTRPELSLAIETARGHGDISENGDYDAAKEKSGMVEAKIRDLEGRLALAQVIDPRTITNLNRVVFGVSVKISDVDSGEERSITIVGADESDVDRGFVSLEAPLGRSLIGKESGDVVKMTLPGGAKEYEILEIYIEYEDDNE